MKVDFMIIGAMKCGTTSLAALLALHPEIGFSKPKETNFFSANLNWREQLPAYENFFRHKKARIYGEGSTDYTKFPSRRMTLYDDLYEYNPQLKFIYLVRHPVHRAVSHYMHLYRRGYTDLAFHSMKSLHTVLPLGRYFTQIQPYIEKFGRDRVLILKFEDFIADQRATLRQVCRFLDIEFNYPESMEPVKSNQTLDHDTLSVKHEKLFKKYILPLQGLLTRKMIRKIRTYLISKNKNRTFSSKIEISPENERLILHYTSLDIQKLQEIVTFDVSEYLMPVRK